MKVSIDYALHEDTNNLADDEITTLISEGIMSHTLKYGNRESINITIESLNGPAGGNPSVLIEGNDDLILSVLNSMGYEEGEYAVL